jgi:uncharacterized protein YjaZ
MPADDLPQTADDELRYQSEFDFNAQGFPIKIVIHIEETNAAAITRLVVHEVHRPDLINRVRHCQCFPLLGRHPHLGLDPPI